MGTYCICLIRLKLLSHFLYIQKKSDLSSLKKGITKVIPSAMVLESAREEKKGKTPQPAPRSQLGGNYGRAH